MPCPLCNGFHSLSIACPACGTKMADQGKVMDYYDDYSAYMEIDLLKENDGFPDSAKNGECPHLLQCPSCGRDETVLVKE